MRSGGRRSRRHKLNRSCEELLTGLLPRAVTRWRRAARWPTSRKRWEARTSLADSKNPSGCHSERLKPSSSS
eukprot:2986379-Pyramimonas_sp.AAC.1